jgi:hypothetical protein
VTDHTSLRRLIMAYETLRVTPVLFSRAADQWVAQPPVELLYNSSSREYIAELSEIRIEREGDDVVVQLENGIELTFVPNRILPKTFADGDLTSYQYVGVGRAAGKAMVLFND